MIFLAEVVTAETKYSKGGVAIAGEALESCHLVMNSFFKKYRALKILLLIPERNLFALKRRIKTGLSFFRRQKRERRLPGSEVRIGGRGTVGVGGGWHPPALQQEVSH